MQFNIIKQSRVLDRKGQKNLDAFCEKGVLKKFGLHIAKYLQWNLLNKVEGLQPVHLSRRDRSSHSEVFLEKVSLKIWSKFTREHPCRSVILINLLCNRTLAWEFCCKFAAYF